VSRSRFKDAIDHAGVPTQAGSKLFAGISRGRTRRRSRGSRQPAPSDRQDQCSRVLRWWETDNLVTGRTNNPWNLERTPGGSSGGESAAIAAGMSPIGLGSDVAISVRDRPR